MTTQERIVERIDLVQSIFRDVSGLPLEENYEALVQRLEQCNSEFVSLAYEAASYKIAVGCVGKDLAVWSDFLNNYAKKHSVQVHIGLGWAVARKGFPLLELGEHVDRSNIRYVADGCGFFYGIFKKIVALEKKKQHRDLDEYSCFFDEGLGRSLWYSTEGNLSDIENIIGSFDKDRQADIWRGIGIAFTYVGGFDIDTISALKNHSGQFIDQVKIGVSSVAKTRLTAGTVNEYTKLVCQEVCGFLVEELA
ncbi:MAG: DUF1702 family protein [Flavobacteriales bacterium]|nr:DUF1702 family protein [Flavobacteriales bacterium]